MYDEHAEERAHRHQVKDSIIRAIDSDKADLLSFLFTFVKSHASSSSTTETPSTKHPHPADHLKSFLSDRKIRTVTITPPRGPPSVTSLFNNDAEGPCLIMNSLLPVSARGSTADNDDGPPREDDFFSDWNYSVHSSCAVALRAGTAAMVAAYAYLHAHRAAMAGMLVLVAVADDLDGGTGGLEHLLHCDERRHLFRGDCVLGSSPTSLGKVRTGRRSSRLSDPPHPLEEALLRNAALVCGRPVKLVPALKFSYVDLWHDLGVPAYSYGLTASGGERAQTTPDHERVNPDDFIALVKIYALAALDYMRTEVAVDVEMVIDD